MQPQDDRTLMHVVADVIAAHPTGCSIKKVEESLRISHPKWKSESVSPAVSTLVAIGVLKQTKEDGERILYLLRHYDVKKDPTRITKYRTKHKRPELEPEVAPVKILFAVGERDTLTLDMKDARALYLQLHQIFGGKIT